MTKDAGWLVYDPKGKGDITSSLQLFGNVTFWLFWENGYHALASLDDNGDGVLTGDELKGLAIWHDASQSRCLRSRRGEAALGVWNRGGVMLLSNATGSHPNRIAFSPKGVTFRDGKTRPTFDLILDPANRPAQMDVPARSNTAKEGGHRTAHP